MTPDLSELLNLPQKLDGKSFERPIDSTRKEKFTKIQLFGQKEDFYSDSKFAFPHCTNFQLNVFIFEARASLQNLFQSLKQKDR